MMGQNGKKKGGRPRTTLTDEQVQEVFTLAKVLTVEQIADYFGFHRATFWRLCQRQPEILQRYRKGRAEAIGNVAKNLITRAIGGDVQAQKFYLKTQAGWRETINVTNEDESMSPQGQTMDADELSDQALEEILSVKDKQKGS